MSDFWTRKLAGSAPPPHIQQPVPQQPAQPGAWWMTPAHPSAQVPLPPEVSGTPGSGPQLIQEDYQTLKGMNAGQMTQAQMEALAEIELTFAKYNEICDQCGSTNFIPRGTKVGNFRMPTAKCFECGNSSGMLASSPEPAVSGSGGKRSKHTRQLGGGQGSYGQHHSQLPQQYLPRGGA